MARSKPRPVEAPTPEPIYQTLYGKSERTLADELVTVAPDPFPSTLELAPQRFRVSLYSSPTKVVEAKSPEEAWALYKPLVGLIASAHTPEIVPDGDDGSN